MQRTIALSILCFALAAFTLVSASAQNRGKIWDRTTMLFRGRLGIGVSMIPVYNNTFEHSNGQVEEIFEDSYNVTAGITGRAEAYPIFSPFLSYGYFAEYNLSALGNGTSTYLEHGHRLFVGYHPIMLGGEITQIPFRKAARYNWSQDNRTSGTETAALSRYYDLYRYAGILRIAVRNKHFIDLAYFREFFPIQNVGTQAYHGVRVGYWKINGIDINFEFSWELYPYGAWMVSDPPELSSLDKSRFYFNLTISKSFDLKTKPFKDWFKKRKK